MKYHIAVIVALLLACSPKMSQAQTVTADSLSIKGWTCTYSSLMGLVYRDSMKVIQEIDVYDIGNDGKIYTELQNAIDALPSIGGLIRLPAGSYSLGNSNPAISIISNTTTGD